MRVVAKSTAAMIFFLSCYICFSSFSAYLIYTTSESLKGFVI